MKRTFTVTFCEVTTLHPKPHQSGMGQIVELRFFGGLTVQETADVLKVSPETVMREWKTAKVWLLRELSRETRDADNSGKKKQSIFLADRPKNRASVPRTVPRRVSRGESRNERSDLILVQAFHLNGGILERERASGLGS
jgi:ECF sigma factor